MRASRSSAAPRRTTRPIAVPSSSVKPSGRRSTTRPPTRTVRPTSVARSTRSASSAPSDRRGAGEAAASPGPTHRRSRRRRAGPPSAAGRAAGQVDVGRGPRRDREPLVGRVRVRPADDAGHRGDAALDERRAGDPGPGLADDDRVLATRRWISARQRSPSLWTLRDRAADPDQPPLVRLGRARRAGRSVRRRRPLPSDLEPLGPQPRRAVRDPDPADDADPRADRRRARARGQQDLDRRPSASWTTIRGPSRRAGSPARSRCRRSRRRDRPTLRARAIVTRRRSAGGRVAAGRRRARADAAGPAATTSTMSAASRSQIR